MEDCHTGRVDWKSWGPFLSERVRGTIREDYSPDGKPGNISRTITPGRGRIDGMKKVWAGFCDRRRSFAGEVQATRLLPDQSAVLTKSILQ